MYRIQEGFRKAFKRRLNKQVDRVTLLKLGVGGNEGFIAATPPQSLDEAPERTAHVPLVFLRPGCPHWQQRGKVFVCVGAAAGQSVSQLLQARRLAQFSKLAVRRKVGGQQNRSKVPYQVSVVTVNHRPIP